MSLALATAAAGARLRRARCLLGRVRWSTCVTPAMKRERKELAVGDGYSDAVYQFNLAQGDPFGDGPKRFDHDKHEVIHDTQTGLWSVFYKRKPKRETWRPVTRVARTPYTNGYGKDRRPVVVTLLPRELIETRLKGTRRRYTITWDDLHAYLVRRHALNVMRARQADRVARAKARKAQRKARG